MPDPETIRQAIIARLSSVIDPETGVDVVRMRLVENLEVNAAGHVSYKFRPSSPFCPIVVPLSITIKQAVGEIKGVIGQDIEIVGYVQAEELTAMFRKWLAEEEGHKTNDHQES